MERIVFIIATGFLQRSWLWFYIRCLTESSWDFFLDVIFSPETFLQSFIFTETTKKISCHYLSHLCTLFHLFLLFPSCPSLPYLALSGTIGDLERPCDPILLMHRAMGKWSLFFLCVWYKMVKDTFSNSIDFCFFYILHSF